MNNGIIANDVQVLPGQSSVRIPIEIWKDEKMLFPDFDESIGGRNLILDSDQEFPVSNNQSASRSPVISDNTRINFYPFFKFANENNIPVTFSWDIRAIEVINTTRYVSYAQPAVSLKSYSIPSLSVDALQMPIVYNRVARRGVPVYLDVEPDLGIAQINNYFGTSNTFQIRRYKLEYGDNHNPVWTPAPEDLLNYAKINPVHCSYQIDGNDIILSNFTETKGYVDIEVSYGDDWVRTHRINFTKKNVITDIQIKDKQPFRAYFNRVPIWWKYHERTQAIFDYANERYYQLPTKRLAYDDYIRGLVKEGLFDKLDLHYIFSGDGDINFKLLNIINPGTYNGTAYGGLEWSNEGVKGNGVNGYIDTNFNPSLLVEGQKYQLNDAFFGGVVYTIFGYGNVYNAIMVTPNPYPYNMLITNTSVQQRINANINSDSYPSNIRTEGFKALSRFSETEFSYISRDQYVENLISSNQLANNNFQIIKGLSSSQFGLYNVMSGIFIGASFTYKQTQLFREIFNNYLTEINLEPKA